MDARNLTEIHKGEIGTGLLIECDGYISKDCGNNQQLFESYNKINEGIDNEFHCPYPFIVDAVFQRFGVENANGRIYPEHILKREVQKYQKIMDERRALAELNHPESSTIDLSRVAINVVELHWQGNTLVGKIEIITSPGFRKFGIISCQGDQTANLLLQGYKIGLSSRGLGSVTRRWEPCMLVMILNWCVLMLLVNQVLEMLGFALMVYHQNMSMLKKIMTKREMFCLTN